MAHSIYSNSLSNKESTVCWRKWQIHSNNKQAQTISSLDEDKNEWIYKKKHEARDNVSRHSVDRSVHHEHILITNSFSSVQKSRLSSLLGLSLCNDIRTTTHTSHSHVYTLTCCSVSHSSWLILWVSYQFLFLLLQCAFHTFERECHSIDLARKVR